MADELRARPADQALVSDGAAEGVSTLTGFDPSRNGSEMLAILMWDYFGPRRPLSDDAAYAEHGRAPASEADIKAYRECAEKIAQSLKYTRNI